MVIDSTGTLVSIDPPSFGYKIFSKRDSLSYNRWIPVVEKMIAGIEWQPGYKNGKPVNSKVYKTFNFVLIIPEEQGFNIIAPQIYKKWVH